MRFAFGHHKAFFFPNFYFSEITKINLEGSKKFLAESGISKFRGVNFVKISRKFVHKASMNFGTKSGTITMGPQSNLSNYFSLIKEK
jgi:hypothetical protein